ncbi:MAG: hypothetical protein GY795_13255 [Desulfobacterales bacterium]|nr:hypothetical protein [Desulfobacterales bacterium]
MVAEDISISEAEYICKFQPINIQKFPSQNIWLSSKKSLFTSFICFLKHIGLFYGLWAFFSVIPVFFENKTNKVEFGDHK